MRFEIPKIGFRKSSNDEAGKTEGERSSIEITRRQALIGGAAAAGVAAAGLLTHEHRENRERSGTYESSELFMRDQEGLRIQYGKLTRNEILFIDNDGAPLGHPVRLEPIDGKSPGDIDDEGILRGEMNQAWLDRAREQVCAREHVACDLANERPRQLNVIPAIREAVYQNPGKDRLNPRTFLDIVRYFGDQEVIGGNGESRISYVRKHCMDEAALPDNIKEELSHAIPGLAAQESKYNNAAKSARGAEGIFQFMPATWRELGYSPQDMELFLAQVGAVKTHVTQMYTHITKAGAQSLTTIREKLFENDVESFERDFLAPVLVNAYNTGHYRMVRVLDWFAHTYPSRRQLEAHIGTHPEGFGKDVFMALTRGASERVGAETRVSGYGNQSREYVPRVYALAHLLKHD